MFKFWLVGWLGQIWHVTVCHKSSPTQSYGSKSDFELKIKSTGHFETKPLIEDFIFYLALEAIRWCYHGNVSFIVTGHGFHTGDYIIRCYHDYVLFSMAS